MCYLPIGETSHSRLLHTERKKIYYYSRGTNNDSRRKLFHITPKTN